MADIKFLNSFQKIWIVLININRAKNNYVMAGNW